MLIAQESAVPLLLWSPCQYVPVPKNMLPTGISLNAAVLSTLRVNFHTVLLSHHLQYLNPARPRAGKSETTGTPAGPLPVPWHSPPADIQLDMDRHMVVWCVGGDFRISNASRSGLQFTTGTLHFDRDSKRCMFDTGEPCLPTPPLSSRSGTGSERHQRPRKSGCPAERRAINSWVSRTHHYLNHI